MLGLIFVFSHKKTTDFTCKMHCHLYYYLAFSSHQNINQIQPLCPLSMRIPQLHCPLMRAWRKLSQGSWLTARFPSATSLVIWQSTATILSHHRAQRADLLWMAALDTCSQRRSVYYPGYALE